MAKTNYEYVKEWRKRNPQARAEEARRYRAKHPEKVKATVGRYLDRHRERLRPIWAWQARAKRKSDPEGNKRRLAAFRARRMAKQEELMGRSRPLLCELCGESGTGRGNKPEAGICFDHCHVTGKPRGWLCDRCNKVLGLVKDSTVLLDRMIQYLDRANGKTYGSTEEPAPKVSVCGTTQELPH